MDTNKQTGSKRKVSSLSTFMHIIWIRKWIILIVWLLLAGPAGVILSIFNLPVNYTVRTILRFPNVQGAQANMMRDISITQKESITSLFQSYQVLEAAVNKCNLRVRLSISELFRKDVFQSIRYTDELREGAYLVEFPGDGTTRVSAQLEQGTFDTYQSKLRNETVVRIPGLAMDFRMDYIQANKIKKIAFKVGSQHNTIVDLSKKLNVRAIGMVNFEISLKDRDPWLVSDILNTLRDEFLVVYYGTTEVQDASVMAQLESSLELAKNRLDKSQNELSDYYKYHPSLMSADLSQTDNGFAYLQYQANQSTLQNQIQRLKRTFNAKLAGAGDDELVFWANEILNNMTEAGEPQANIIRSKLYSLNRKQAELKSAYNQGHPKLQEVQAEINAAVSQINNVYSSLMKNLEEKNTELELKISQNKPQTRSRPSVKVELELDRLQTANQNNEKAYDNILSNYNRAKLTTGAEFFKVSVVDKARPAIYKPSSLESRLLKAGVAVCMLFFLCPLSFIIPQLLFIRIWTRDDISRFLGLRILTSVKIHPRITRRMKKKQVGDVFPPDPFLIHYGVGYELQDLESFRTLREECLDFYREKNDPVRLCLLTTSTRPGEGKSTCTANLAISFARTGRKVLLMDADFRLGRIARMLAQPHKCGMTEILNSGFSSEEETASQLTEYILPTMQENLSILPKGGDDEAAGELMGSDKLKTIIRMVRGKYDIVLIDTPPLITPDSLSIFSEVDGVIFVCFSGLTLVSEAWESVRSIQQRKIKIATVLNGTHITPFQDNQYKKYGYYYKTGTIPGKKKTEAGKNSMSKGKKPVAPPQEHISHYF